MNAKEIISSISKKWFLTEPLMFDLLCSHKITENPEISTAFRTGQGRIEYNPRLVEQNCRNATGLLQNEIYRILLKHPYERVPPKPNRIALKKASDITIRENCLAGGVIGAKYYDLKEKQSYEDYYKHLKDICPNNSDAWFSPDEKTDFEASELWEENERMSTKIQNQIEKAAKTNQWGSISGSLVEKILARKNIRMDYRRILARFRTSVMTQNRTLTRLRPNRRYGFDYMGSRYKDTFRLLVAVDSSGSISAGDLENFFSVINRFFKYGAKEIEVIVFDTKIKQKMDFKKAQNCLEIEGRGRTNFQAAVDYYEKAGDYDGMIIFTDGFAKKPKILRKKKILWILNNEMNYAENRPWIQKIPGSEVTWIGKAG